MLRRASVSTAASPANFSIDTAVPGGSAGIAGRAFATPRGDNDFQEPGVLEPTMWGMIVAGFGMLGTAQHRRTAEAFA
jgi:hypothetical protein